MERDIRRILLIEDDEEDVFLLKKQLARIWEVQYEFEWVSSYEQGLARLREDAQHDACLLDYRLGEHTGIELLLQAQQRGYRRPIILLTGATGGEIDIQALKAGADDYIDKSQIQGELLHRMIRYAIERKKAEIEREKLLSEQLAAQELEKRKNEFMNMIVHEIKTPLTSITGYAQLLNKRFLKENDEQAHKVINRLTTQVAKLDSLLGDLVDGTRIAGGTLSFRDEMFTFDDLVKEAVEDFQVANEQMRIDLSGESGAEIWGDRMRIGQVITNFLTNALKYASASEFIVVTICSTEQQVSLSVKDFGPGISQELQDKIFTPFFRIDRPDQRSIPGLGLGLHIATEIIKRHEGRIWVESEEGHGATFSFSLKLKENKMETP